MKSKRTSVKIFITAMMAVVLMASFALTTFADANDHAMSITYTSNGYAITDESIIIFDSDNNAIGSVMFSFIQIAPFYCYIDYQISLYDGTGSDYLRCYIVRNDTILQQTSTILSTEIENEFVSGTNGDLSNTIYPIPFYSITQTVTAELTIFKYNTTTHLLEEYKNVFTLRLGYTLIPPYDQAVYTVWDAFYEMERI